MNLKIPSSSLQEMADLAQTAGNNVHILFFALQCKLAEANSKGAKAKMDLMEQNQADQKTLNDLKQKLDELKAKHPNASPADILDMDPDLVKKLEDLGVDISVITKGKGTEDQNAFINKFDELIAKAEKDPDKRIIITKEDIQTLPPGFTEAEPVSLKDLTKLKKQAEEGTYNKNAQITAANLEAAIAAAQSKIDRLGSNGQQELMQIQQLLGSMDAYITGAGSVLQKFNQVTENMANFR